MSKVSSPFDSITFGNPLSLRVDSNYLSIMSIAPCGRDAVLAGRKGLLVIDLDDPFAAPRWLHHETSWEVADVQWSPHKSKPSWVVSTSNQKAMVWNLARPSNDAIEYVLHSHTRAITDIHFHPDNPEMLATCSVDSFVLSWDLRCPQEPINKWADWRASASQVKWNYKDPNIIASSHDNHIIIWDARKGAIPLTKINAHDAKINGLDWSRENKYELVSCSNDMSVKIWSYDKSDEVPTYTIRTDFPVSKTRHVPFGDHICGIMPLRGGNNSVYIVDYKNQIGESKLDPSFIFKGHTEPVKDFVWRTRHSPNTTIDDSEYQLVTWSSDSDLRLWPIDEEMYGNFNFVRNQPLPPNKKLIDFEYRSYRPEPYSSSENNLIIRNKKRKANNNATKAGYTLDNNQFNHLNWISGIKIGQSAFQHTDNDPNSAGFGDSNNQPLNLGEEVSNVGHKFPKLRFERISVSTGNLVISLNGPWSSDNKDDLIFIRVEINFPKNYPSKSSVPKFKVEETHELKSEKRQEIMRVLQEISTKFCNVKKFCLEPCMRCLLGEKITLDFDEVEDEDETNLALGPFESSLDGKKSGSQGSLNSVSTGLPADLSDSDDDSDDEVVPVNSAVVKKPAFDSTPVPKGCGAVWTASGHLVVFFIPKEDKKNQQQIIKFGQQGFSLVKNLKRKRVENGLAISDHSQINHIDEKLSDSDDSGSDTSEDSLSNDLDILQYDRFYRTKVPDLLKNVPNDTRQYSSNNARSNPLSAPTDKSQATSNSKMKVTRNIVKIYDFRNLIPSKMELAYEYRVLGDSPHNLAEHNSIVAERYGYREIADCWRILSIILVKDVHVDESLTNDKRINLLLQSELLEKFSQSIDNTAMFKNYRFYWGYHPFGGRWLAKEIMKYFEKIGNIQMLAMLSCIMYENSNNKEKPHIPINIPYTAPQTDIRKSLLLNRQDSVFTTSSSIPASPNLNRSSNPSFPLSLQGYQGRLIQQQLSQHHSTVSFNRRYSRSIYSLNQMVSSPTGLGHQHRVPSVSTISSIDADCRSFKSSSPAGDYSNMGSYSNRRGIKQVLTSSTMTPNESIHGGSIPSGFVPIPPPALVRSSSNVSGNIFNHNFGKSLTMVKEESTITEGEDNLQFPIVHVQMLNVEDLDLYEDVYSMNLEGFMDNEKLKMYRSEYAAILFCWGLPVSRLKMLKFNYNDHKRFSKIGSDYREHCGEIGWIDEPENGEAEEIIVYKNLNSKWRKSKNMKKCHLCELAVTKRLSVCSKCNHMMHAECSQVWWEKENMQECPSGCGCECLKNGIMN